MKAAYFDCSSGISGDMCLGALVHAGVPLEELKRKLGKIPLRGYSIGLKKVKRAGVEATKLEIRIEHKEEHIRRWKDIRGIIEGSKLPGKLNEKGLKIFKSLFLAEAVVHGVPYDKVHVHELGSIDTIIDVMGTLICLEALGIKKLFSSPVNLGGGLTESAHGALPVPAPATAELLRGVPVYSGEERHELTTPTGAALLKALSSGFGGMPEMTFHTVGMGAGSRNPKDRPNVLRVFLGTIGSRSPEEEITVLETNIDDMNPQIYGHLIERLLKAGALDVFLTQVIMKKGRPGVLLTVLSEGDKERRLSEIMLTESTTFGLRKYPVRRTVLERKTEKVMTKWGEVRLKTARLGGKTIKAGPEYEDCRKIAERTGAPLVEIMDGVRRAKGPAGRRTGR